jgi:hypothetical protein
MMPGIEFAKIAFPQAGLLSEVVAAASPRLNFALAACWRGHGSELKLPALDLTVISGPTETHERQLDSAATPEERSRQCLIGLAVALIRTFD